MIGLSNVLVRFQGQIWSLFSRNTNIPNIWMNSNYPSISSRLSYQKSSWLDWLQLFLIDSSPKPKANDLDISDDMSWCDSKHQLTWSSPSASNGFRTNITAFLTFGNIRKNSSETLLLPDPVADSKNVFWPLARLTALRSWTSLGLSLDHRVLNLALKKAHWSTIDALRTFKLSVVRSKCKLRADSFKSSLASSSFGALRVRLRFEDISLDRFRNSQGPMTDDPSVFVQSSQD